VEDAGLAQGLGPLRLEGGRDQDKGVACFGLRVEKVPNHNPGLAKTHFVPKNSSAHVLCCALSVGHPRDGLALMLVKLETAERYLKRHFERKVC
jgi:hypothetical protein